MDRTWLRFAGSFQQGRIVSTPAAPLGTMEGEAAMSQTIQAVYEGGVFRPCAPVSVPDGAQVTLTLHTQAQTTKTPTWPALPPEFEAVANDGIVAQGTRIDLTLILRHHFQGASWEAIADEFPTVCASHWPAIAHYVDHNRESLKRYWEQEEKLLEELRRASPSGLSLQVLRERFEQKHGKPFPRLDAQVSH